MALKLRRILFGSVIALPVYVGSVAFLVYFLPYHEVLRIVGAETRRPVSTSKSDITTHDVFYIYAEEHPVCFTTKALAWYALCRLVSALSSLWADAPASIRHSDGIYHRRW